MKNEITETQKHAFCQKAIDLKGQIEVSFLSLGAMLHKIREERLFEAGWDSWDTFEMELKLSPATISKLIRIYEVFVMRLKIKEAVLASAGGWSVVAEYLPLVVEETTPQQATQWLETAATMPRADIRREVAEMRRGGSCAHKETRFVKLEVCEGCGDRWRVGDDNKKSND